MEKFKVSEHTSKLLNLWVRLGELSLNYSEWYDDFEQDYKHVMNIGEINEKVVKCFSNLEDSIKAIVSTSIEVNLFYDVEHQNNDII